MQDVMSFPQYVFFDLSGTDLACFDPTPSVQLIKISDDIQVLGLDALHQTRLSRTTGVVHSDPVDTMICDDAQRGFDTVSDSGTSGLRMEEKVDESEDEASIDEFFFEERFSRKIEALAELVGMKDYFEPAVVLGEVVRALEEMEQKRQNFVVSCATGDV